MLRIAHHRPRVALVTGALLILGGVVRAAAADETQGWHTVRPGDTLRDIAELYLGSQDRWIENWRLNPDIADPDLLLPGQRIRVLREFDKSVPSARISTLSGRVEENPAPIPWTSALIEDLLLERDGLRTFDGSSIEMTFPDGTNVVLSEDSLVYLLRAGRTLERAEPKSVEIVEGQAEIASRSAGGAGAAVEIVMGETRATSSGDASGLAQARARRDAEGAKVMVYEGSGAVASVGATVELPRGTGSSVPRGAPPSPAEKLLPAPAPLIPPADSEWRYPNPEFTWKPVAGADGYTIEVCSDPDCRQLVLKRVGGAQTEWKSVPLPVASLYWRVTALSPSGLDGYPSGTHRFAILSDKLDPDPPTGRITVVGRRQEQAGAEVWRAVDRVEVELEDPISGVASWKAFVNDDEVDPKSLDGPWSSGVYTVRVTAVDRAGNEGELEAVRFRLDNEPPAIEFEVGGRELLREKIGNRLGERRVGLAYAVPQFVHLAPRRDRRPGPRWRPIAWGNESNPMAENYLPREWPEEPRTRNAIIEVDGTRPQLILEAPGLQVPDEAGGTHTLDDDEVLWLAATDEHGGVVATLVVLEELAPGDDGRPGALRIRTFDVLGNRGSVVWRFR